MRRRHQKPILFYLFVCWINSNTSSFVIRRIYLAICNIQPKKHLLLNDGECCKSWEKTAHMRARKMSEERKKQPTSKTCDLRPRMWKLLGNSLEFNGKMGRRKKWCRLTLTNEHGAWSGRVREYAVDWKINSWIWIYFMLFWSINCFLFNVHLQSFQHFTRIIIRKVFSLSIALSTQMKPRKAF